MLQQTQVKTVIPYWERWMRALPTVQKLAEAPSEKYLKLWEGLGYYTRARNLQRAAQQICEKHNGKFPDHFADVLALPGIGRYTAGAICSIAFHQATPILDGNVVRVLTRVFGIEGNPRERKTNESLWQLAKDLVERASHTDHPGSCSHFNQSLMELGALVCTPRQPKCAQCPVHKSCIAFLEERIEAFPNLPPRTTTTKRTFIAYVVERKGRYLVRQRPASTLNALLWEFPNVERISGDNAAENGTFQLAPNSEPICSIKHSITRYRMTLDVFRARLRRGAPAEDALGKWLSLPSLRKLPFTSAHRRILDLLPR